MMPTGSGVERAVNCAASNVLPRAWADTGADAARGIELHGHLERIGNGTDPAESLEMVDGRYRGACEAVDLEALTEDLELSPEVTLVYNPFTDTARILGQSLERDYSGVTDEEIPMTLDLVGVNLAEGRGAVRDYKSGWARISPTRRNWQMLGGSLALSRVYDLDVVDAQLIYLREGVSIRRDPAIFTPADFAVAAGDLRIFADRAAADRARYARGEHVEPTEGSWCKYCPSLWCCPAKTGLIRSVITPNALEERIRGPLTDADAVALWHALKRVEPLLKEGKTRVMALAAIRPLLLETTPDGVEVWLGEDDVRGHEKLDPEKTIEAAAEVFKTDPAQLADLQADLAEMDVTKKRLDAAIKKRVAKGKGAETARQILELVRARGGSARPTKREVAVYKRTPDRAA